MKIGILLRKIRLAQRYSMHAVAENMVIGTSTYADQKNDKKHPSILHLAPLAKAYGVCPIRFTAYLFGSISLEELLDITSAVPDLKVAVDFYQKNTQ